MPPPSPCATVVRYHSVPLSTTQYHCGHLVLPYIASRPSPSPVPLHQYRTSTQPGSPKYSPVPQQVPMQQVLKGRASTSQYLLPAPLQVMSSRTSKRELPGAGAGAQPSPHCQEHQPRVDRGWGLVDCDSPEGVGVQAAGGLQVRLQQQHTVTGPSQLSSSAALLRLPHPPLHPQRPHLGARPGGEGGACATCRPHCG